MNVFNFLVLLKFNSSKRNPVMRPSSSRDWRETKNQLFSTALKLRLRAHSFQSFLSQSSTFAEL